MDTLKILQESPNFCLDNSILYLTKIDIEDVMESVLDEREYLVLERRFFTSPVDTLEVLAKRIPRKDRNSCKIGVTREAARQLERRALRKLYLHFRDNKDNYDLTNWWPNYFKRGILHYANS